MLFVLGALPLLDLESHYCLQVLLDCFSRDILINEFEVIEGSDHHSLYVLGRFVGFVYFEFEEVDEPLCDGVGVSGVEPYRNDLFVSTSFTLRLLGFVVMEGEVVRVQHHALPQLSAFDESLLDRKGIRTQPGDCDVFQQHLIHLHFLFLLLLVAVIGPHVKPFFVLDSSLGVCVSESIDGLAVRLIAEDEFEVMAVARSLDGKDMLEIVD